MIALSLQAQCEGDTEGSRVEHVGRGQISVLPRQRTLAPLLPGRGVHISGMEVEEVWFFTWEPGHPHLPHDHVHLEAARPGLRLL